MTRKDWVIYGAVAILFVAFILTSMSKEKDANLVAPPADVARPLTILPAESPKTVPKEDDAKRTRRIADMRARFTASVDHGSTGYIVPARAADNSFVFNLNFAPKSVGCNAGDLDLITKALPKEAPLLITVDSDSEKKPSFSRRLSLDALRQPFSSSLKIPPPQLAKVYRVTLCSDVRDHGDCKAAVAAPMDQIEAEEVGPESKENHIFFAQTFVVDAVGIQFMNNLRQDLVKRTFDPSKAFGPHLADSAYLKQLPAINALVKPVPTTFQNNTLTMGLTYRDIEVCKAMGGGR